MRSTLGIGPGGRNPIVCWVPPPDSLQTILVANLQTVQRFWGLCKCIIGPALEKLSACMTNWPISTCCECRRSCYRRGVSSRIGIFSAGKLQNEPDVDAYSCCVPSWNRGSYGWDRLLPRQIMKEHERSHLTWVYTFPSGSAVQLESTSEAVVF